jgi:hypothetical protein
VPIKICFYLLNIELFFYRAHLANDGHPVNKNTTNMFLTQTDNTTQNGSTSDVRSSTSASGVPKLPQITSTTNP